MVVSSACCLRRGRLSIFCHGDRPGGVQQILNGHVECGGKAQGGLRGEAELADLVIGDDGLDDVDAQGELALAESAHAAEVSQALAEGEVDGLHQNCPSRLKLYCPAHRLSTSTCQADQLYAS
jgi:hypothetical protein